MGVDLSVVLPVYREKDIIGKVLDVICESVGSTGASFEIVCVDDGSRDGTLDVLEARAAADERVRVLGLSRNFGKEAALAAGLAAATGNAVLVMDADLQHPADLIPRLVAEWRDGADVVNAVKERRASEGLMYRAAAKLFNVLMGAASGDSFQGASDFKLLDRQVVDILVSMPERNRFFRGLVQWVGFRTVDVPFHVADRVGGESKWSTFQLIKYSARNLVAFSVFPLKLVAAAGFITLGFAAVLGIQTLVRYFSGDALSGFTTVILVELIIGGVVLTSLGVIAVYLSATFEELKRRPVFVVRRDRREAKRDAGRAQVPAAPREDRPEPRA